MMCFADHHLKGSRREDNVGLQRQISLWSQRRLTRRAADLGYAPRFLSICLALGVFRFEGESTLPPQAGNAHRWAAHHLKTQE